jgi:hypothetical protein
VEPGVVPVGIAGGDAAGVWKYSGVVKVEQPVGLHAATFHRYVRPALRLAVKLLEVVVVSITRLFVPISRTPTS